jgi:hypothetical protein
MAALLGESSKVKLP